mmetsp:Transcript_11036/g.20780  ORF Transcript_11036/g.20780 Transcript_11036/m.20780 type:complete len:223 (+) Transcript_11036:1031-1699(+)
MLHSLRPPPPCRLVRRLRLGQVVLVPGGVLPRPDGRERHVAHQHAVVEQCHPDADAESQHHHQPRLAPPRSVLQLTETVGLRARHHGGVPLDEVPELNLHVVAGGARSPQRQLHGVRAGALRGERLVLPRDEPGQRDAHVALPFEVGCHVLHRFGDVPDGSGLDGSHASSINELPRLDIDGRRPQPRAPAHHVHAEDLVAVRALQNRLVVLVHVVDGEAGVL